MSWKKCLPSFNCQDQNVLSTLQNTTKTILICYFLYHVTIRTWWKNLKLYIKLKFFITKKEWALKKYWDQRLCNTLIWRCYRVFDSVTDHIFWFPKIWSVCHGKGVYLLLLSCQRFSFSNSYSHEYLKTWKILRV